MDRETHYATVSEAINKLRAQGFTEDFNLPDSPLLTHPENYVKDEFEVVDVYRYEGDSDPGDEATVYAIQSKSGLKGVLVTGYGHATDENTGKILKKLAHKNVRPNQIKADEPVGE